MKHRDPQNRLIHDLSLEAGHRRPTGRARFRSRHPALRRIRGFSQNRNHAHGRGPGIPKPQPARHRLSLLLCRDDRHHRQNPPSLYPPRRRLRRLPQMDLDLPLRSHHPLRLHEDRRRCVEIPGPPLLLHRLRRIHPAHRKTGPQHPGPPELNRSRPAPAHAPHLEPRQRRRRLASVPLSARPLPGPQPTRRGPTRPALPRSLLALRWRSHPLLRSLHPRQTLRPQPARRKLRQAPAHDVRGRRGGHGTGLLVHARRSLLPFRACRHGAPLAEAGVEWWHNHFLSIDYGYGKSSSSVGLYVRGPAEIHQKIEIPASSRSAWRSTKARSFPRAASARSAS